MPTYNWDLIASNANIPQADGVAHCVHPNGYMFMWGGVYTVPPSPWKALYRAHVSAPGVWTNLGDLPCTRAHLARLIPHSDGRIYKVRGDHFNPASQAEFWSVDENGGDFEMISTAAPWAGMLGHATSFGAYIHVFCGQTVPTDGITPSKFFTHWWRWSRANGFELVTDKLAVGARGVVSNDVIVDGKLIFPGGGNFETWDHPRRFRDDIYSLDLTTGEVECLNGRVPFLSNMYWHSAEYWDDNFWILLGGIPGNPSVDLTAVRRSPDMCQTFIQEANFPGTARHAAALFKIPQGLLVGTGSHYGKDLWLLSKDAFTYTAQQAGTTGWGATYTVVDDNAVIAANETIAALQIKLNSAQNVTFKIVRRNSASSFTTVYTSGSFAHPGGSVYAGPTPNFTTPNDGATYRAVITYNPPGAEVFANGSYKRAQATGDLGPNVNDTFTVSPQTDGTICMRWSA